MRSTRQVLDATLQTPEQAVRQELVLCWALRFGRESHFSQARIQGQEIKKTHTHNKNASLAPIATSQEGGQHQSSVAPGLSSLEPWLPLGNSLPQSLVLSDQILTFWSSEHSFPSLLGTQGVTAVLAQEAQDSTSQGLLLLQLEMPSLSTYLFQGKTRGLRRLMS